jgi:hypothetical protein
VKFDFKILKPRRRPEQAIYIGRLLSLAIGALALTAFIGIAGGVFARLLRSAYGAKVFWPTLAVGVFASQFYDIYSALSLACLWAVIGVYTEFEFKGWGGISAIAAAIATVLAALGSFLAGVYFWAPSTWADFQGNITLKAEQLLGKDPIQQELINSFYTLAPTLAASVLLINLALALALERKMGLLLNIHFYRSANKPNLTTLRLPNFCIWAFMFSFLFSFWEISPPTEALKPLLEWVQIISGNVFGLLLAAYFFQGLGILEVLLWRLGWTGIMRVVVYFFLVSQLFLAVCILGVIDFWIDFRPRLLKSLSQSKKI